MNRLPYICISISAIFALSCTNNNSECSSYANTDMDGWKYGDTLYFDIASQSFPADSDTIKCGELQLVVRHTNNYEYSNLWLELQYTDADTIVTDTLNIQLADTYGAWLGKGLGISFQRLQPVKDNIVINTAHELKISHIMRVDTLENIEQLGVVFIPHQDSQK